LPVISGENTKEKCEYQLSEKFLGANIPNKINSLLAIHYELTI
jgi:hypothetical protein